MQQTASAPRLELPNSYRSVQLLRALAAGMVVVSHALHYAAERFSTPASFTWAAGVSGVDIFFIISGFVMMHSSERLRLQTDGWWRFACKRLIRIVPLYWLACTLKLLFLFAVPGVASNPDRSPLNVLLSYCFLPTFNIVGKVLPAGEIDGLVQPLLGVGWTLIYEMFFYLLFTLALLGRVRIVRSVGAALLLCTVIGLFRRAGWSSFTMYFDSIVLEFLYGMFLYRLVARGLILSRRLALLTLPLSFALLASPWHLHQARCVRFGLLAFLICYSAISLESTLFQRTPAKFLFLGDASYALYLFHPLIAPLPAAMLAHFHLAWPWISVLSSFVFAVVASCGVYRWIDKPMHAALSGWMARYVAPLPLHGAKPVLAATPGSQAP